MQDIEPNFHLKLEKGKIPRLTHVYPEEEKEEKKNGAI